MALDWMAWTWQTAAFFGCIGITLVGMTVWAVVAPQAPRMGILRFETTPGDRLFVSLLGSAFIHLGWLGLIGDPLWAASIVSVVYAAAVFRWV
ncbi:DUF2160 domain-containing protein [Novispirillum itersonii]|uniref:DUF2160 domain-containing protein n=1 Tax=Novispirillum itersonii TaxID=189 RepID=UPI000372A941|nr:DUF2160 domain-containing protein [Novispirillum itersonii]